MSRKHFIEHLFSIKYPHCDDVDAIEVYAIDLPQCQAPYPVKKLTFKQKAAKNLTFEPVCQYENVLGGGILETKVFSPEQKVIGHRIFEGDGSTVSEIRSNSQSWKLYLRLGAMTENILQRAC